MTQLILSPQEQGSPNGPLLQIEGEATLENISDLKQALLELLAQNAPLTIDFAKATRIDLACLQLVCSARRSAENAQKKLYLRGTSQDAFRSVLEDTGFQLSGEELSHLVSA